VGQPWLKPTPEQVFETLDIAIEICPIDAD
jgi:hypothetical protein